MVVIKLFVNISSHFVLGLYKSTQLLNWVCENILLLFSLYLSWLSCVRSLFHPKSLRARRVGRATLWTHPPLRHQSGALTTKFLRSVVVTTHWLCSSSSRRTSYRWWCMSSSWNVVAGILPRGRLKDYIANINSHRATPTDDAGQCTMPTSVNGATSPLSMGPSARYTLNLIWVVYLLISMFVVLASSIHMHVYIITNLTSYF